MVLIKFLILLCSVVIGVSFMKYNYQLTQLFGLNSLAERYLGNGGTYSMWKILGVLVIVGAIWYTF